MLVVDRNRKECRRLGRRAGSHDRGARGYHRRVVRVLGLGAAVLALLGAGCGNGDELPSAAEIREKLEQAYGDVEQAIEEAAGDVDEQTDAALDEVRAAVENARNAAGDQAGELDEQAHRELEEARDGLREARDDILRRADEASGDLKAGLERVGRELENLIQEIEERL